MDDEATEQESTRKEPRASGWNDIRNVALCGLGGGAVLFVVAILLRQFRSAAAGLAIIGFWVMFISAPLFLLAVVCRDATSLVENKGRFDLRGMLMFMTLVALLLLLIASLRNVK